jgi:hypothetical protein
MAQVIEFESLARFTPTSKWPRDDQRGKVIPFISQRKALYKPVCAAYEELQSQSSRWPNCDDAFYRVALEYAQQLILEEDPLLENSSDTMAKSPSGSPYWACSPRALYFPDETIFLKAIFLTWRHVCIREPRTSPGMGQRLSVCSHGLR